MSPIKIASSLAALRQRSRRRRKARELAPLEVPSSWTIRPQLQALEDRTVPAGTVKLSNGLLLITGTTGVDTALVQQISPSQGNPGEQVAVTLNGATSTFKASLVNQITASLLAGNDTITLDESVRRVTPPLQFDSDGGIDSLIYKGTTGDNAIAVTGSTISLAGAGTLTYNNFESLDIDCLGGTDTVAITMTTLTNSITVHRGTVANSNITTVAAIGKLDVTEVPPDTDAGLISNSTFGTVAGQVLAGSIVNSTFNQIAHGASVTAAGQGTTTNVSIGTLSGSFTAPEDANPGSGVMSNTTINSITSTGSVSTGHISGMTVGTAAAGSSITAAGQGTTTNVSIGTLSGSFTAPEDANPGSGVMSNTTINSITSTGSVSTGHISGMTVGTAAAGSSITAAGQGTTTNVSIGTLSGSFTAPEDANPGSGVMSSTTINSITSTGSVSTGHISGMTVGTAAAGSSITAAGQGTTTNVSIGTLGGSFRAPEDANPGSGVMSNTTINSIASTGVVSTGAISGMTVGTAAAGSSITAAGQGTTTNVSIGTLSGSFTAPEDANPGSGVMSSTTINSITSTGSVSTGHISGMTVGTAAAGSSITAAGQGTTTNVSIGTLSGSFTAPEDANPGSGVMSNTTINSITSTGVVSTGAISGMSVGTAGAGSSIIAAGHGTITNITIDFLAGTVTAELDANPGSGTINFVTIGTMMSTGGIFAGAAVNNLSITTIEGGDFEAGTFGIVTATEVVVDEVHLVGADATRTLKVSAVSDSTGPESYSFSYDGTGSGNPVVSVHMSPGAAANIRYDFSLLTDTVGAAGSGVDLASFTSDGKAFLRNLVVAGNLTPAPGTFAVNLPLDVVAVAAAGNIPAGSIKVLSAPAVAFGSANGIAANIATTGNAAALFAPGTSLVQANDTFLAVAGDGVPVAMFPVTGSNFNADTLLFTDQGTDNMPVAASVSVAASSPSAVQQVHMTGEAVALRTKLPVMQAINVLGGSLGDLTLISNQDTPSITAPRIVGNLNLSGRLTRTIETTVGDLGRAFTNAAGVITGVTTVSISSGGGITSTGRIISAGNLVSSITTQSSLDGVIAVQGDIGVIQTDSSGNAVVGTGPGLPLTRFGGITVSTGGMNGSIVALGNAFGDINVSGGLNGRIAIKGRTVAGLDASRMGILGNLSIGGGTNPTAAIVSGGRIGDDGNLNPSRINNDSVGTKLSISGAAKGIIAAVDDINFGSVGNTSAAFIFENTGPSSTNGQVIASIFTDGGVALAIPDGLSLILLDLSRFRVGPDGNLTVSPL